MKCLSDNPSISYTKIAKFIGISRERVRQLAEGLKATHPDLFPSSNLLTSLQVAEKLGLNRCRVAELANKGLLSGIKVRGPGRYGMWLFPSDVELPPCPICSKPRAKGRKYCSVDCYKVAAYKSHSRYSWRKIRERMKAKKEEICPSLRR